MQSPSGNKTKPDRVNDNLSAEKPGFVHESEDERLLRDIFRSDLEKLHLFTQMIRRSGMYKKAPRRR
jgi:hypothetical protein